MAGILTVATFTSPLDAHIAKGRLEAEGISAFIAHEHHISVAWFLSNALSGVKIRVLRENRAEAEKIVQSLVNGDYEETLSQHFGSLERNVCPRCKSANFESRFPLGLLALVFFALAIGVLFPVRRNKHRCGQCDYKWKC